MCVMCVCVLSSSPLQGKALLLLLEGERGPPFYGASVCAVFRIYSWCVSDVACRRKEGCESAAGKTAAPEQLCGAC